MLPKNIVAAGLAERCEIRVSYAIGVAEPTSIFVNTLARAKSAMTRLSILSASILIYVRMVSRVCLTYPAHV